MSKQISLEELHNILERKYFFTKERFFYYFNLLGEEEKDIRNYWDLWESFPCFGTEDGDKIYFIINKLLSYPKKISTYSFSHKLTRCHCEDTQKNKIKIYYIRKNELKNFEVNLNETDEVIVYAEFLRLEPEIVVVVDLVEEIYENGKTVNAYNGDIFTTRQKWFNKDEKDGEVIVCTHDGYRKLLYTKGRGYIRDGKPDFDEQKYSRYKLILKDKFICIGNIYADSSFLIDPKYLEGEDNE